MPIACPRIRRSRGINSSAMADFSSPLSAINPGTPHQLFSHTKPVEQQVSFLKCYKIKQNHGFWFLLHRFELVKTCFKEYRTGQHAGHLLSVLTALLQWDNHYFCPRTVCLCDNSHRSYVLNIARPTLPSVLQKTTKTSSKIIEMFGIKNSVVIYLSNLIPSSCLVTPSGVGG